MEAELFKRLTQSLKEAGAISRGEEKSAKAFTSDEMISTDTGTGTSMRKVSLTLKEFLDVYIGEPYTESVVYHIGGGEWSARASHGHLTKPDGSDSYSNLPELLADLASVGIRCIRIEWNGLPPSGKSW